MHLEFAANAEEQGQACVPLICRIPPLRVGELDNAGWADGGAEWVQPLIHLQGFSRFEWKPLEVCVQMSLLYLH